jgi:hypothetical protein
MPGKAYICRVDAVRGEPDTEYGRYQHMSEFLNILQNLNPDIESSQADELRAVFVALSQQTENVEDSTTWSLNRWLQWLDDEGFDRTALMGTLNSLGIAATGQQAWDHLSSNLRTHMEDTDGLGLLQEMVEREDPELLARLHTLETVALSEDLTLAQTAGGLSKVVKDSLYGVGGVVLVAGALKAYKVWKNRRRLQAEAADAAKREEDKLENDVESRAFKLEEGAGKVISSGEKPQGSEMPIELAKQQNINASDNLKIFVNEKDIAKYTADDIEHRAGILATHHMRAFFNDYFTAWTESTIKKMPKFTELVAKEVDKNLEACSSVSLVFENHKKAEEAIIGGDWYNEQLDLIKNLYQNKLRQAFQSDAKPFYKDLLEDEINAARKDADNKFYDIDDILENDGEEIIRKSKVGISKEAVKLVDDAKSLVRRLEKQAERDLRISEVLI